VCILNIWLENSGRYILLSVQRALISPGKEDTDKEVDEDRELARGKNYSTENEIINKEGRIFELQGRLHMGYKQ
jgi:hypothetical protein